MENKKRFQTNQFEEHEKYNPKIEIGSFLDVEGMVKYYALEKAIKNTWGNEQNEEFGQKIKEKTNIINIELIKKFKEIKEKSNNNEETLRWLAFAENKNFDIKDSIIKQIVEHKGIKEEDFQKLMLKFSEMMNEFSVQNNSFEELKPFISQDKKERESNLPELKKKIEEAINFFQPENVKAERIIYLPTNPLENKQSGNGIDCGSIFYINAEKDNETNKIHEFLHCIINPMIEKIVLSKEDEKKILRLCPKRLKDYQIPKSILTEEIIRTYDTGFVVDNKPGWERYKKMLLKVEKSKLQSVINKIKEKGDILIENADELLNNDDYIRKYYEKYGKDDFSERVWSFFENYKKSSQKNFESYLLENYKDILYYQNKN